MGDKIAKLVRLVDSHLVVADPAEDIEGYRVLDSSGAEIGIVDDLVVDEMMEKVHFLQVASGGFLGFGARKFLVPVEAVARIGEETVHIDGTCNRDIRGISGRTSVYDPELIDEVYTDAAYYDSVYGFYGYHDPVSGRETRAGRLNASAEPSMWRDKTNDGAMPDMTKMTMRRRDSLEW